MNYVVLGAAFGDEGKGVVTDFLASKLHKPIVVRFCGGPQAGHTVVRDGFRHVFSNFGSGTFAGAPTYWSEFCTIDPIGIMNEYGVLINKGVKPLLYIDKNCPVTTPYDQFANINCSHNVKHGTCGVGYGKTIEREEKFFSLKACDILFPDILKIKLDLIKNYYNFDDYIYTSNFIDSCKLIRYNPDIKIWDKNYFYFVNGELIFEGAQGLLLDQHYGFFPHVTRSNTGMENVYSILNYPSIINNSTKICIVTRGYQTRHGNGPMLNDDIVCNVKKNPLETNVDSGSQGIFRYGVLNIDLIKYALSRHGISDFTAVITCLEHMDENSYEYVNGGQFKSFDFEDSFLRGIYHDLCGDKELFVCKDHKISSFLNGGNLWV